ncbi:MAG: hypothetical protein EZS28_022165 [Streblomastix strix]|uniref:KilA-N domain-containing protein n=1 Tax=Streblomastix strix TaxID=222440 RepID=A0A5J4VI94_9EUKA|nr:MAG: hypothetical protein EZS28_022165 [Streblomastix strix]
MESTVRQYNEIKFKTTTYNGITIVVRSTDEWVNASKMVMTLTKNDESRLVDLFKSVNWIKYYNYFKQQQQKLTPEISRVEFYKQNNTYPVELRGYYVHPKLVNYIAIWASPQYASDVGEIMDSINKNSLAQHIIFEKNARRTIDRLNEEVMEQITIADNLADDIEQLVPRTVFDQQKQAYILILNVIDTVDNNTTFEMRRLCKNNMKIGLLNQLKLHSIRYFDNLPVAVTSYHEIQQALIANFEQVTFRYNKFTLNNQEGLIEDVINVIRDEIERIHD